MKVFLAGAGGQLGQALLPLLGDRAVWSGGRHELDVRDADAVARAVSRSGADVVINAAAYNDVDGAETHVAEALAVNAAGAGHLARASRDCGAVMVHVSTDYVFDGARREPYAEDDPARPLSVYGVSKLAGALLVAAAGGLHLIVSTSGLFGRGGSRIKGGSFVERVLARARAGEALRVVDDQVFAPTYAPDLAAAMVELLARGARGAFHVTNSGACSWHELAVAAVELAALDVPVERIDSARLGARARRPAYSVLSHRRFVSFGLPPLRPWRDALREFLAG